MILRSTLLPALRTHLPRSTDQPLAKAPPIWRGYPAMLREWSDRPPPPKRPRPILEALPIVAATLIALLLVLSIAL